MSITKDSPPGTLPQGESLKLKLILAVAVGSLFLLLAPAANAAFSFQIDSVDPNEITSVEDVVTVNLTITDLPSESYFRVAWQESSGKSYLGYVKNQNGDWVKIQSLNANCTEYYHVNDTSIVSLTIETKIGEGNEISNGDYNLKAHRFTSSCNSYKESSNSLVVKAILPPTPTPIPPPTNTPRPDPTPTTTSIFPSTPTPSSIPTSILPSVTDNSSPKVLAETDENSGPEPEVNLDIIDLTATTASETNPSPTPPTKPNSLTSPVFIISAAGAALMLAGGIPLFWLEFKSKKGIIFK